MVEATTPLWFWLHGGFRLLCIEIQPACQGLWVVCLFGEPGCSSELPGFAAWCRTSCEQASGTDRQCKTGQAATCMALAACSSASR